MSKQLPDFIIAGAPKCGTTALWHFLNKHPNVFLTENKEPRFFTRLKGDMETRITGDGPRLSGNYNKGDSWYEKLFAGAKTHQLKGEASTVYFANEDAAGLIYKNRPQVKLIIMLRHPVKRIYSHYWQEYKVGFKFPGFDEMIKENNPRLKYYKQVSHYKEHLNRYYGMFKREQILIIIQEEFNSEPALHFDKVLNFLGLPPHAVNFNERLNEQVIPKNRRLAKALNLVRLIKLNKIVPSFVFNPVKKLHSRVTGMNVQKFDYPPLSTEAFNTLLPEYTEDIHFVEELFGRSIHKWHTA